MFLENISQFDSHLANLIKEHKKKNEINKFKDKTGTLFKTLQKLKKEIIRKCYEKLYTLISGTD